MTTPTDLIARLQHLVSLNEPKHGGPYRGAAAEACVNAMREAAGHIATLTAEREALREALAGTRCNNCGAAYPFCNWNELRHEAPCKARALLPRQDRLSGKGEG